MDPKRSRGKFDLERVFASPIEDVWGLWTTPDGLESWWGPDGFTTRVLMMDLRVGGELRYAMTAVGPDQVAFMQRAGMPLTQECRATYREIVPHVRLAYIAVADFVPEMAPYDVETLVELTETDQGVRMRVTIDAMHDAEWTRRARMGWEMQLDRLVREADRRRALEANPLERGGP